MKRTIKHDRKRGVFVCKVCKLTKDSFDEIIRHRHYTVQQWKKFDITKVKQVGKKRYYLNMQEVLCKKYEIILLNHKTRGEKINKILDMITFTNMNEKITKFQGIMKKMDGVWESWDKHKNGFMFGGSKADYSILIGKSEKKDYSFLIGSKTRQKSRQKTKQKTRKKSNPLYSDTKDYSALIGKRKKVKLL